MDNIIDSIVNNDIQEITDKKNKNKIIIISWIIVWLIVIIWIAIYFFTSSKAKEQSNIGIKEDTIESNKEDTIETKKENPIDEDTLCKQKYWNNATVWEPWYCTCIAWYEWNNGRTRCVKSRKINWITKEHEKIEEGTTFFWEGFEGEDASSLIPLKKDEKWQQFEENSYTLNPEPDYKYESWEELINTIIDNPRIKAIHDEDDEDYLTDIINDINTKKKNNNKNSNISTEKINTNTTKWESSLIETFIWTIESKQTNEGILYYYTFTDPSFWTTPVRIWFVSKQKITNSDISTDIWWKGININKLKFHWGITNAEVTKDFWITRCWLFEPEWYVFNPGQNKFSLKGYSEEWFTYINHFRSKIYPVFAFPWTELSQWNKNCMVEIGRKENFPKFPFELKWSFENAVVAVTKNKDANSNCPSLLWNHDNTIVIYNEELACEIWYNNWTSLREITTK